MTALKIFSYSVRRLNMSNEKTYTKNADECWVCSPELAVSRWGDKPNILKPSEYKMCALHHVIYNAALFSVNVIASEFRKNKTKAIQTLKDILCSSWYKDPEYPKKFRKSVVRCAKDSDYEDVLILMIGERI